MIAKTHKFFGIWIMAALFAISGPAVLFAGDAEKERIVTVNINQLMEKHPAFDEARQTLQREARELKKQVEGKSQQAQQGAQQQFQQRSRELQAQAVDKIREDIQKIAKQKGYKYVMDANALLAGGEDVTEEILQAITEKAEE